MLLWVKAKSCIPLFVVQQSRCDSIVSWCALGMASQCICPMHNLRQTASKPSHPRCDGAGWRSQSKASCSYGVQPASLPPKALAEKSTSCRCDTSPHVRSAQLLAPSILTALSALLAFRAGQDSPVACLHISQGCISANHLLIQACANTAVGTGPTCRQLSGSHLRQAESHLGTQRVETFAKCRPLHTTADPACMS
jgi:hypothetical protein